MNNRLSYTLNELDIIGKGNERIVLLHPEDNTKVLKVAHNQISSRLQNDIESLYFEHLNRKKVDCPHIPKYFGKLQTERGFALIFEKIENSDRTRALQLDELIQDNLMSQPEIKKHLKKMFWSLFKNNIVFTDISPTNIVCKKEAGGEFTFIVIDGIGSRYKNFKLWLYMHIGFYAKYKLFKQFSRLSKKIDALMKTSDVNQQTQ